LLDRMYKEYARGTAPPVLERLAELYRRVDSFALVSGEYNHGIPPALKYLLDHFLEEYFSGPPPSFAIRRDNSAASVPRCSCA